MFIALNSPFGLINLTVFNKKHVRIASDANIGITINRVECNFSKEIKIHNEGVWTLVESAGGGTYYSSSNLNLRFKDWDKHGVPSASANDKLREWIKAEVLAKLTSGVFDSVLFEGELNHLKQEILSRKNEIKEFQEKIAKRESEVISLQNQFDKLRIDGKL